MNLDAGGPRREWSTISASKLAVGDTVSAHGMIHSVSSDDETTVLTNVMGDRFVLIAGEDDVYAFTANG